MYARTNRCYNELGSKINYVRSSIPHCTSLNRHGVSAENHPYHCRVPVRSTTANTNTDNDLCSTIKDTFGAEHDISFSPWVNRSPYVQALCN